MRAHAMPGAFVVDDPSTVLTKQGKPYTVFTPYARTWRGRRAPAGRARAREIALPSKVDVGRLPSLESLGLELPDDADVAFAPGEENGRKQMAAFLRSHLSRYADRRDRLGEDSREPHRPCA